MVDGTALTQEVVLPETILNATQANLGEIGFSLAEILRGHQWQAKEYRDNQELPDFNVLFVKGRENLHLEKKMVGKMKKIINLLGYAKKDLKNLNIYLDPESKAYQEAKALYNNKEEIMWVKEQENGLGMEHELCHWATLGLFEIESARLIPNLLKEGVATWLAWQTRNNEERREFLVEDYSKIIESGVCEGWFSNKAPTLDQKIHNIPAMYLGAILFDILFEKAERNHQEIGRLWRLAGNHDNVSNWLEEAGFSVQKIEKEWQKRIYQKKPNFGFVEKLVAKTKNLRG